MAGWRGIAFAVGALGPVAFLAAGQYGAWITPNYSQMTDAVSALSQRGAANARPINAMFAVAAVLQICLGAAVVSRFVGWQRRLTIAGALIVLYAGIGAAIALFFPMDPIGVEVTTTGILHLVFVGLSALMLVVAMVLARKLPDVARFGGFTLVCLVGMFAGGGLATLSAMLAWPVLGLAERLTQTSYLLWLLVLAVSCLVAEMRGE